MKTRSLLLILTLALLTLTGTSPAQDISVRSDSDTPPAGKKAEPSIFASRRVYAPIEHRQHFQRERELFGYDPKFSPGVVSFDRDNRPYLIDASNKPIIQTLDDAGRWIELDFGGAIRKAFPEWDGKLRTDAAGNARIFFDRDGDAYLYANTGRSNLGKPLLLYSKDRCRSWTAYPLPFKEHGRMEVNDTFNLTSHPPAILFFNIAGRRSEMWLVAPEKQPDGSLTVPEPKLVTKESANVTFHSGDGNSTVSVGDKIHIIWLSSKVDGKKGVRHFAATYDRSSDSLSDPVFVGRSNEFGAPPIKTDNHNFPVMTVDSRGYLHAILGTHHHPFTYLKSRSPDSVAAWSAPELIGEFKKDMDKAEGSYTYPSIHCDPSDNIHCVARWAGDRYFFSLVHLERSSAQDGWLPQNVLVVPSRAFYAVWYHKVSMDRSGNLVVYYMNYQNQFDDVTLAEYNKRWPSDGAKAASEDSHRRSHRMNMNIKPRDPAILMRPAGDSRWFLATTSDFAAHVNGE